MSRKTVHNIANQISEMADDAQSIALLEKVRELYEVITILHYNSSSKQEIVESIPSVENENLTNTQPINQEKTDPNDLEEVDTFTTSEENLSVLERIKQIMEAAPQVVSQTKKNVIETNEVDKPTIKKIEPEINIETKVEKIPNKIVADEFQDAISADYAADLFEKAKSIEITKKSLNDKLSQNHVQIGLNDRIAFVKHLFNGNQADFNRVFSQLNTFTNEADAKNFIETLVKPDYNWDDETEYEERLISLIERKFL